jgi:V/A-type H+-transporting ATPase subunit K
MTQPEERRSAVSLALGTLVLAFGSVVLAADSPAAEPVSVKHVSDIAMMWGFISAALATGIGALGAAYAVGHVGAAALGAMGERPEISGRALIFLGLAEGIAIYGLIVSIMILGKLG